MMAKEDLDSLLVRVPIFGMPYPETPLEKDQLDARLQRIFDDLEAIEASPLGAATDDIAKGCVGAAWEHYEHAQMSYEDGDTATAERSYWRAQSAVQGLYLWAAAVGTVTLRVGKRKGAETLAARKETRTARIVRIAQALLAEGKARRGIAQRIQAGWKAYGWRRTDGTAPSERTINEHLKAAGI